MTQSIDIYRKRDRSLVQAKQYQHDYSNNEENIFEIMQDRISNFFSKGYNIARFIFFIIIMLYLLYTLVTAISSVPEGQSLTISLFLSQIVKNFNDLKENFPIFQYLFTKISNLVSAKQVNFLIFLGSMLGTILMLMCFCP